MKVLIVDDEEDVRYVVRMGLQRVGGMTVIEATSGPEGVARARNEQPDCILLDMMMPGMDGVATLQVLLGDVKTSSIPVVFLTAQAFASDVQRLQAMGARGVVLKPFNPLALARDLEAILHS